MFGSACLLSILSAPAVAGDVVQGANQLAMGGVGVAAADDNAAISINPGLLGLEERYDFHAHFRLGPSAGMQWAVSALDARTSDFLTLGIAYSGDRYQPPLTRNELPGWALPGEEIGNLKTFHDVVGSFGVGLLKRRISFGGGVNVGAYSHDRQGNGVIWDLHTGIGVQPIDELTFGVSLRDFVPLADEDRPLQMLAGGRVTTTPIVFEADIGWNAEVEEGASPWDVASGIETGFKVTRLRLGARRDGPESRTWITGGIGYAAEGAGLEYGLAWPIVSGATLGATVHQVSVRFGAQPEIEPF